RGRFDVGVRLEGAALPAPRFSVERARTLYQGLAALRDELSPGSDLGLSVLAGMPGLVIAPSRPDFDSARSGLRGAFELALTRLDEMREQEGRMLEKELLSRLDSAR